MPIQSGTVSMGMSDPEWHLHEGSGLRTADSTVVFGPAFAEAPKVLVSISTFHAFQTISLGPGPAGEPIGANLILTVEPKNIRPESFEVEFKTELDSRISAVVASWLAHTD